MRVPISWLKDYVDITLPTDQLAEKLTLAGLEVEKIEYIGVAGSELPWDREKIVVAQVRGVERHPNADKLLLVTLAYGPADPMVVVTGAPNLKPGDSGQKVVLAMKGSRLYDGHKEGKVVTVLKEATLRGIKNDAMVCSEKELGISDEHDGIILLPDDAPVGTPLADYLGDAVLEVAILANTTRCAGIVGIAREVAALTGQTLRYPPTDYVEDDPALTSDLVRVEIRDPALNPRFTAGIVRNIKIGPSPWWMQRRLKACGVRAISNVVDISNYVMLELNHPTHTFDYDAIRGQGAKLIYTRVAEPGEKLTTLDGKERELQPTDILVCDEGGGISLAGTMGGATSEVGDGTKNVLLELASWNNVSIRKTARYHDLHSEASFRFARGLHPAQAMLAQRRGLYLLQKLAGGTVTHGVIDVYPAPPPTVVVDLDPADVTRLVGMAIPVPEMERILTALEFKVEPGLAGTLRVTAPDHRLDIEGPHDLIEEIARVYGYDKLPTTLMGDALPPARGNPDLEFEERLKDLLVDLGLQEIVTYRMTSPESEFRLFSPGTPPDDRAYITLVNPIHPERTVMRHTLATGALETISSNLRHTSHASLFEVGSVYLPGENADGLPDEQPRLVIAMAGAKHDTSWLDTQKDASSVGFFELKGVVEAMLAGLNVTGVKFSPYEHPTYFPGRTAQISLTISGSKNVSPQTSILGIIGELHPKVREAWGFDSQTVALGDFDIVALRSAAVRNALLTDVPKYPAVQEDLAIVVDEQVSADAVAQSLARAGGNLMRSARLFDVYRGEQIGAGKKSLAFALSFQADDRTLDEKDLEKARNKIIRSLESQLGASMRK